MIDIEDFDTRIKDRLLASFVTVVIGATISFAIWAVWDYNKSALENPPVKKIETRKIFGIK